MVARPTCQPDTGEDGLTLIEMLVTLVILGSVSAVLLTTVITMGRSVQRVEQAGVDQSLVRNSVATMSKDLRSAAPILQSSDPAFSYAGSDRAEFTANLQEFECSRLVRIFVDSSDRIVEDITPPDDCDTAPHLVYDTANSQVRFIAAFLANEPSEPLLRYYDASGAELVPPAGGSLPAASLPEIAQVSIHLAVQQDTTERVGRSEIQTRVRLPNAGAES